MPTSLLIFFLIVVGLPVTGGIGAGMFQQWLKHKEKLATTLASQTAEKAARYAAHTERLEQRVRVLERIVTTRGMDLGDEIERLRDQPAPSLTHDR